MTPLLLDQLGLPEEIEAELTRLTPTYDLVKVAEKGSNGFLVFARNRVLNRDVALKFYFWADGVREHIEPSALAQVRSPAIIEVLDASIVGREWALFITPFIQNGDLDKVRESRRFGLHEGLALVEKLLNGVAALHAKRYLHRDLKPENILITDGFEPLIADFGSVRRLSDGADQVPGSGHSVLYRPPESFSTGVYDRRGDVYQCGMVLFQVLGGKLEYEGLHYLSPDARAAYSLERDPVIRTKMVDEAIAKRAQAATLCSLDTLPFFVPPRVKRIVGKALAPDPSLRYQQASDMLTALREARQSTVNFLHTTDGPVAAVGGAHFRLLKSSSHKFILQMKSGSGWRRVPRTSEASLARQLKALSDRAHLASK